ncbi:hypothetical protein Glove_482g19 [Diversispora epigaea]|uniref:Uncharacterized protein n=1 Tax=Diversispora epigaea TaxID=1348612 RepID=A0A397GSX0_9GLOM|nr:hypothetical protein Glove_482g19 [Diversispora epigaea]
MPYGIYISKNEPVSALHTKILSYLKNYGNARVVDIEQREYNLRAVDIERSEYVYMEPEKKISDYFTKSPREHVLLNCFVMYLHMEYPVILSCTCNKNE